VGFASVEALWLDVLQYPSTEERMQEGMADPNRTMRTRGKSDKKTLTAFMF
jgi:hypothetical protein